MVSNRDEFTHRFTQKPSLCGQSNTSPCTAGRSHRNIWSLCSRQKPNFPRHLPPLHVDVLRQPLMPHPSPTLPPVPLRFKMSAKSRNISPSEDIILAKSCVSVSQTTSNMRAELFWSEIHKLYQRKNSPTAIPRTSGSLETRLLTLSRVTQKYLAAEKL